MEPVSFASKIALVISTEIAKKIFAYSIDKTKSFTDEIAIKFNHRINDEINHIDRVKTLWTRGKSASISEIYYPTKLSIQDTLELFSTDKDEENITAEDVLTNKNVVIKGIVGQGKSFYLRYLALNVYEKKSKIPMFIELMKISKENTIYNEITRSLENFGISVDEKSRLSKKFDCLQFFSIFLDGFDEVNSENVKKTLQEIESLARLKNTNIYITTRPGTEIIKSTHFKHYSIKKITKNDYVGFIDKLNHVENDTKSILINKLQKIPPQLADVVSTPLMLTLFVMVYLNETIIPDSISEFYSKLFNTVFSRHDNLKPGFSREKHCKLSESKFLEFFEAFSFISKKKGFKRTINSQQFVEVFNEAVKKTGANIADEEHFRKDIVNGTNLMLDDGFDLMSYTHRSLQEYYSATFIKKLNDTTAEKFYKLTENNYSEWSEVLRYLSEIDSVRFHKNFSIPILNILINELSAIQSEKNKSEQKTKILDYILKYIGDSTFRFSVDGDTLFLSGMFGGVPKNSENWTSHYNFSLILPKLFEAVEPGPQKCSSIDDYNLSHGLKINTITTDDEYSISISVFIKNVRHDIILGLIEGILHKTREKLFQYQEIVSIDTSKSDLFDI